jgi:hypothetical protein
MATSVATWHSDCPIAGQIPDKEKQSVMAKQILKTLGLDDRSELILLSMERLARTAMTEKVTQLVRTLTGYICGRRRREAIVSFMSRKSHEDERRLEFERFLYW